MPRSPPFIIFNLSTTHQGLKKLTNIFMLIYIYFQSFRFIFTANRVIIYI